MEMLRKYRTAIKWCINTHLVPQHERADVYQDVCLKVLSRWRRWGAVADDSALASYMYTVTRNVCLNHLRANKQRRIADMAEVEQVGSVDMLQDEWLHRQDAHRQLHLAIATLPPMSRAVMHKVLLGNTTVEIAAEFGITVPAAKHLAQRARTLLRNRILHK